MSLEPFDYNTKEGISRHLRDLATFGLVVEARRHAGYDRKERLQEFIVMGRYALDTCGNIGFMDPIALQADPVMTFDEFKAAKYMERMSWGLGGHPHATQRCLVCRKQWTLENWGDHTEQGHNGGYAHKYCARLAQTGRELQELHKILDMAGLKSFALEPVPNRYWPGDPWYATPWYRIETPWGPIIFGNRKRVIEINWEGTGLQHLFPDDVTKNEMFIHAWTNLDAARYLDTVRRKLEEGR